MHDLLGSARSAIARWRWWLEPWEVDLYGLRRRPIRDQSQFLSGLAMNLAVRPALNDASWSTIADNKWLFAVYFGALDAAIPATYGLIHPVYGMTSAGDPLRDMKDFEGWLSTSGQRSFVLKPLGGRQGRGVQIVVDTVTGANGLEFTTIAGQKLAVEDLRTLIEPVRHGGLVGYLLQERLEQHPFMHLLNEGSPNSFRLLTAVDSSGEILVQRAVMRSARVGAMVDGWNLGGLLIDVDETSGRLGAGQFKNDNSTARVKDHPDTGFRFADQVVPDWSTICDVVRQAARMAPGLRVLGWDVVLSDVGPRIVEANVNWDLQMLQATGRGVLGTEVADAWTELGGDPPDGSLAWRWKHRRRLLPRLVREANRRIGA